MTGEQNSLTDAQGVQPDQTKQGKVAPGESASDSTCEVNFGSARLKVKCDHRTKKVATMRSECDRRAKKLRSIRLPLVRQVLLSV